MADEFKHLSAGTSLTQGEYEAVGGHVFACQATGDIVYASSGSQLSRLGKGAANTILAMGGSCIPAWTASPSVTDLTIGGGCITLSAATDIDLLDNNASALSFDASGKTGIIDIVTTNCSEGVTMSGTLGVTGVLTANAGVVVDNFTLDGTELDLSSGDFALDVAGDIEFNADGGCVNFKDASLALAAIVNSSCVGELRIHEAANYVGFKAPALSGDQIWTLPAAVASCACDVLTCNGSGVLSWATASGVSLANNTNNYVVTATGSGLNGEANLQFDGTLLTLANASCRQILAPSGAVGKPGIAFAADVDNGFYLPCCNNIRAVTNGVDMFNVHEGSGGWNIEFGDTGNANGDHQMTLNQLAKDNVIFALKSSDVAHGMTDRAETDTYFQISKSNASQGGAILDAITDNCTRSLIVRGSADTCGNTTTSRGAGWGVVDISAEKISGTGNAAFGNCVNIVNMANGGNVRFILKGDGDMHVDGSATVGTFDDYCDVALLTAVKAINLPDGCDYKIRFSSFIDEHAQFLHDNRVITLNDDGHHFVSYKGMMGLTTDALRQLHGRIQTLETQLTALQGGK